MCIRDSLGTLSDLYLTKDRGFRLKDMPLILKNLIKMIPEEHSSKLFLEQEVQPLLLKTVKQL